MYYKDTNQMQIFIYIKKRA